MGLPLKIPQIRLHVLRFRCELSGRWILMRIQTHPTVGYETGRQYATLLRSSALNIPKRPSAENGTFALERNICKSCQSNLLFQHWRESMGNAIRLWVCGTTLSKTNENEIHSGRVYTIWHWSGYVPRPVQTKVRNLLFTCATKRTYSLHQKITRMSHYLKWYAAQTFLRTPTSWYPLWISLGVSIKEPSLESPHVGCLMTVSG